MVLEAGVDIVLIGLIVIGACFAIEFIIELIDLF